MENKGVITLKPSRKFLSLPIVSLSEGQHIGYVKNLVIDAQGKSLAALVIDPKGFFRDQRIIPYNKVISVGDDAITIDKGNYVEKSTSLPEILTLIKEKLTVIGTRVITESGKTLGVVEEYYIDPESGKILQIEISGGKIEGLLNGKALLDANYITTIGHDVIVAQKGCESSLQVADKGINESIKSLIHSTSSIASGTTQALGKYFKKDKKQSLSEENPFDNNLDSFDNLDDHLKFEGIEISTSESDSAPSPADELANTEIPSDNSSPSKKEPLG